MANRTPSDLKLHRQSASLELVYGDGESYRLSAEYLRVHSPSAEVRGHGRGQEVLQVGKRKVGFTDIEAMGNYAIRLTFDDGHDSGIYSWDYLYELCSEHDARWRRYLDKLSKAHASRDPLPPETQVITIQPLKES